MDKFTKEQQVQAVYDLKVGYTLGHADIAMLKSMARQLLASMEQEPMAWVTMQKEFCDDERTAITNRVDADRYSISCYDLTPLYAAPQLPHPAVPDEIDVNDPALDTHRKWMAEGWNRCRAAMLQAGNSPVTPDCLCRTCRPVTMNDMRFVVCPECGNKRCPHANDHNNACTGSNEPGQAGSAYPAAPQQEVKNV